MKERWERGSELAAVRTAGQEKKEKRQLNTFASKLCGRTSVDGDADLVDGGTSSVLRLVAS